MAGMVRDSGRASKSAILSTARDLENYTNTVQNELNLIQNEAASLSELWKDEQFKQFLSQVERMTSDVERELNQLRETRRKLEERARMM